MSENLLGWQQFDGKILPKHVVDSIVEKAERSPTRLQVGERVKVKITDKQTTVFADATVVDYRISSSKATSYSLAFPLDPAELFWIVTEGFNGAGGWNALAVLFGTDESADGSCILTLAEYEAQKPKPGLKSDDSASAPSIRANLRVVNR